MAWWGWAIGIGVAVNGTTNPLLLTLIAAAMVTVVLQRRSDAPWARSVRAYLVLAAFVIGIRLVFQILIGAKSGLTVLFTLPEVALPAWAAGIHLGGAVTAEALAFTVYDALRLAVLLLCIGAANALASPRQALKSVPAALYEASVAVVVALNVAPQLIESGIRIRRARRLRGDVATGPRALGAIAMAVLSDAIDRSLSLAAGMEARGFARTRGLPVKGTLGLMLVSIMVATMGGFLLLSTRYPLVAAATMALGIVGVGFGLRRAGARLAVTRHRPHPWGWRESLVLSFGVVAMVVIFGVGSLGSAPLGPLMGALLQPMALFPSTDPLVWPDLSAPMLLVVALVLAPIPLTRRRARPEMDAARTDHPVRSLRPVGELVSR